MTTTQHAFLAPSAAGCTVHCAAAPKMQALYPEDAEHPVTREGIACHWAGAEQLLRGLPVPMGTAAPNGVILDRELVEAVSVYVDDVQEVIARHTAAASRAIHIEETTYNDALHPDANGGTPDVWGVFALADRLYVPLWDAKFGHGLVEVFENWQLINYAALILKALGNVDDRTVWFDFRIIQPRAYHMDGPVRTWYVRASDLRGHFNRLTAQYAEATEPDPVATPGPHCKTSYCTAAGRGCDALARASWVAVDVAYNSLAHNMPPAALGLTLHTMERALKMLTAQVDGMKVQALAMETRGERVPHWTVTQGLGRVIVPDEKIEEFIIVGDALGVDVRKPPACITPKQAESRGLPPDVVKMYSFQRTGERKLVPDDGAQARKVFG